jgi:uncharacterized protein (DUF2267 family)
MIRNALGTMFSAIRSITNEPGTGLKLEPAKQPTDWELDAFVHEVSEWLSDVRPVDAREAMRAVFSVLSRHVPRGRIARVQAALPEDLRAFWIAAEERVVAPPDTGARPRRRAG